MDAIDSGGGGGYTTEVNVAHACIALRESVAFYIRMF